MSHKKSAFSLVLYVIQAKVAGHELLSAITELRHIVSCKYTKRYLIKDFPLKWTTLKIKEYVSCIVVYLYEKNILFFFVTTQDNVQ